MEGVVLGLPQQLKEPVRRHISLWNRASLSEEQREQQLQQRGWAASQQQPYRPLGTPELNFPTPRQILREGSVRNHDSKPQTPSHHQKHGHGTPPGRPQGARGGPDAVHGASPRHQATSQGNFTPRVLPGMVPTGREDGLPDWVLRTRGPHKKSAGTTAMQEHMKAGRLELLRVKAGQYFQKVIEAAPPNKDDIECEWSARTAVEQSLSESKSTGILVGNEKWRQAARRRLHREESPLSFGRSQSFSLSGTLGRTLSRGLNTTLSRSLSVMPQLIVPSAGMEAAGDGGETHRPRHRMLDPTSPCLAFDIAAFLDSLKPPLVSLPKSLRAKESSLHRQASLASPPQFTRRSEAAANVGRIPAAEELEPEGLVEDLSIATLRGIARTWDVTQAELDADLAQRLQLLRQDRPATYRKKSRALQSGAEARGAFDPTRQLEAVRFRTRMEATQELMLALQRTDWVRPLLDMLYTHARKPPGITQGEKELAQGLLGVLFQGHKVDAAEVLTRVARLPLTEHYHPGVQDVVTLLLRFLNIHVKELYRHLAEALGLDACTRVMKAYELRWRTVRAGFAPMKALQRFMRPVKEHREGFARSTGRLGKEQLARKVSQPLLRGQSGGSTLKGGLETGGTEFGSALRRVSSLGTFNMVESDLTKVLSSGPRKPNGSQTARTEPMNRSPDGSSSFPGLARNALASQAEQNATGKRVPKLDLLTARLSGTGSIFLPGPL